MPRPTAITAEDQPERGHAVDERGAEIAVQRRRDEPPELHPQRPVQPEPRDRLGALDLVGLGADQDIDRIAERVDAEENQHRHGGDDEQTLRDAAEQEGEHGSLPQQHQPIIVLLRCAPKARLEG
jgi:hypothetical protein